jgi:drug/metabolite transporter (DMT)-like permease
LSTMGWGIYTVAIRPLAQKHGSLETACLTLAVSAIPMLVFVRPGIAQEVAALAPLHWAVLVFLILCGTFLTLILWNHGVATIRSSVAGMWLYVQPVVAAAGGVLLLGETVSWPLVVGGAVIIAGVAVSQWRHVETEEFPPMQPEPRVAPVPRHRIKGAVERLVASAKEAERFK